MVPDPMTSGVVVRSSTSAARTEGLPFPFVFDQQYYLPDAMPRLRPGKSRDVYVNVYGLEAGEAKVSGTVVGSDGQPVQGSSVSVVKRLTTDQPGLERLDLSVDPGKAPPKGVLSLRVTVEQGERSATGAASLHADS